MSNNVSTIQNCTGCGLCSYVCPKNAIELSENNLRNHFIYPTISNDECVNCGACLRACPSTKRGIELKKDSVVFCFTHNEKNKLMKSSSGGAFQKIAEELLNNEKASVYGASWDGMNVIHKRITSKKDLQTITGSKYIQSYVSKNVYRDIKNDLKNGYKVLFSGTPCQIAAVSELVGGKDCENIILVQILCHGVPNQWSFDKCVEHENTIIKGKIQTFCFRYKTNDECDNRKFKYTFLRKKYNYETIADYYYFPFYRFFHSYSIFRESCYKCNFRKYRFGDLIIGDFWGISKIQKNVFNDYSKSLIISLTNKGDEIVKALKCKTRFNLEEVEKYNESIFNDVEPKIEFKDFYNKIDDLEFYKKYRIHRKLSILKIKCKNFIKSIINIFLTRSKKMNYTSVICRTHKINGGTQL